MKSATTALIALLNSGADYVEADLYTLTLSGGTVVRWSGADIPLTDDASRVFVKGPLLDPGTISSKIGVEVGTMTVTITADSTDLINGTPIIPFIAGRGLDGALISLDTYYAPDWSSACTGTLNAFKGKVTSIGEIAGSSVEITVSSWMVLLNVNVPPNLYQAACLHTVYDSGCALAESSFTFGPSPVTSGSTQTLINTSSTMGASLFAQGRILFLTGPNTGITRTIKDNGVSSLTLISPLPAVPTVGDTYTISYGCDLTQGTCGTKFNNLGRFKASPYCPVPETVL